MRLVELKKGYEILYKYTDGSVDKFRTTPIIKTKEQLEKKLEQLKNYEGTISAVVRNIKYYEFKETNEIHDTNG